MLREKISHVDRERTPERIVHARGSGAHGFFELTNSLAVQARWIPRVMYAVVLSRCARLKAIGTSSATT